MARKGLHEDAIQNAAILHVAHGTQDGLGAQFIDVPGVYPMHHGRNQIVRDLGIESTGDEARDRLVLLPLLGHSRRLCMLQQHAWYKSIEYWLLQSLQERLDIAEEREGGVWHGEADEAIRVVYETIQSRRALSRGGYKIVEYAYVRALCTRVSGRANWTWRIPLEHNYQGK